MGRISVLFENDGQERVTWCWAAVCANIKNSFKLMAPGPFSELTRQCEVVRVAYQYRGGDDPCVPEVTRFDGELSVGTGLAELNGGQEVPTFQVLKDQLGIGAAPEATVNLSGKPVAATIESKLRGFGALTGLTAVHSVAISAMNEVQDPVTAANDYQHVWVEDPYYGPQNVLEFDYEDFVANYDFREPVNPGDPVIKNFVKVKRPGEV